MRRKRILAAMGAAILVVVTASLAATTWRRGIQAYWNGEVYACECFECRYRPKPKPRPNPGTLHKANMSAAPDGLAGLIHKACSF